MTILINALMTLCQTVASTIIILKQTNEKSLKTKLIFFLAMFVYTFFVSFFIPNEFRFFLFLTVVSIITYFILNIRDKKSILYSFIALLIFVFSELFISIILVVFGVDSVKIVNNPAYNLFANMLISILSIIIIYLPFISKVVEKLGGLFEKNSIISKYLFLIIIIIYLIVAKNGLEFVLKSNYYINIFFLVGIVAILNIIIRNELRTEQLNEKNRQMFQYVTKYEKIITEQGKANHEFKNQLMVIRGYAQMNSNKLIDYIDSIVEDSKKTQSSYLIRQINNFPEGGIKGLLYYKLSIMEDEKIKYELDVENGVKSKLNNLSITTYKNITKILGVLMDNAIDASKKSKDKKINIYVTKNVNNVIFLITNTYKGKLDFGKIGTGYSSKGSNHGFGLRLVNDIVINESMFKIENFYDEKYYSTKLIINIGKKNKIDK